MRNITKKLVTLGLAASMAVVPALSLADGGRYQHRQDTANQWRGLSLGSAAIGLLGFATGNDTLGALGAAGAIYSGTRFANDDASLQRMRNRYGDDWGNRYDAARRSSNDRRDSRDNNNWRNGENRRG